MRWVNLTGAAGDPIITRLNIAWRLDLKLISMRIPGQLIKMLDKHYENKTAFFLDAAALLLTLDAAPKKKKDQIIKLLNEAINEQQK